MIEHLGIIADGNRRWARERGLPTFEGHRRGLNTVKKIIDAAIEIGIPYITFYIFSVENWGRSAREVSYLMKLFEDQLMDYAEELKAKNGKLIFLGGKDRLKPKMVGIMEKAEKMTADCDGITVSLCFNYGGAQEIAHAATVAAEEGKITPETIRKHLYHPEVPDLDMVVRTSGEERISGFMLWRASYAEFLFLKKYFPDLNAQDVKGIVEEYDSRERRFGK